MSKVIRKFQRVLGVCKRKNTKNEIKHFQSECNFINKRKRNILFCLYFRLFI